MKTVISKSFFYFVREREGIRIQSYPPHPDSVYTGVIEEVKLYTVTDFYLIGPIDLGFIVENMSPT